MSYPDIAIKALNNAICDDQEAYQYLVQSKWKELAAFSDFICCRNTSALNFILRNRAKCPSVVAFIAALDKNEMAFNNLLKKDPGLAAVVSYVIKGSEEAFSWLEKNGLEVYAELALTLSGVLRSGSDSYGSISFGGGGFSGGGGFGGFGGGGFSGGGSGGSW